MRDVFARRCSEDRLSDRVGGQPAVQAVASGLVDRVRTDQRVTTWFAATALALVLDWIPAEA